MLFLGTVIGIRIRIFATRINNDNTDSNGNNLIATARMQYKQ